MDLELPPSVDVNDFLTENEPEYNWLIPGILEVGDRLILTGREGHGKSTLLRQIGIQVAMGIHPFTLQDMKPFRVSVVDLENPRSHLRREVRKIKRNLPIDVGYLTISSWPAGLNLADKAGQMAFVRRMAELKPDLLIIGPMYKMAPHLEQESDSAILSNFLDQLRISHNFTLLMESHQPHGVIVENKMHRPERPFGSSLWLRWPEFGLCLEDDGRLRPWRGARDETRIWPEKLVRADLWPWVSDVRRCVHCGNPLGLKQEKYCSERCGAAERKATQRARSTQGSFIEEYDNQL